MDLEITLRVNGTARQLSVDTGATLLDALRERLGITGPVRRAATTASAAPVPSCSTAGAPTAASPSPSRTKTARSSRSKGSPTVMVIARV